MITPTGPPRHCQVSVSAPPGGGHPSAAQPPEFTVTVTDQSRALTEENGYTRESSTSRALHGASCTPRSEEETRGEVTHRMNTQGTSRARLAPKAGVLSPGFHTALRGPPPPARLRVPGAESLTGGSRRLGRPPGGGLHGGAGGIVRSLGWRL